MLPHTTTPALQFFFLTANKFGAPKSNPTSTRSSRSWCENDNLLAGVVTVLQAVTTENGADEGREFFGYSEPPDKLSGSKPSKKLTATRTTSRRKILTSGWLRLSSYGRSPKRSRVSVRTPALFAPPVTGPTSERQARDADFSRCDCCAV